MKVLLVAPKAQYIGYSRLFLSTDEISLGLLLIDAMCRKHGHDTRVVLMGEEETESVIAEFQPEVLGITSVTPSFSTALRIVRRAKKTDPELITVFGGHHVSALPEESIREDAVDFVVRGEGEEAFVELLRAVSAGIRKPDIQGVCYLDSGTAVNAHSKAIVEDLDSLPFMDQEILQNKRVFIVSSRGCPFQCDFCSVGSFYERKWRKRSVASLMEELSYNEKKRQQTGKGITWVDFRDDNLTVDASRLLDLCSAIEQGGWGFSWHCQSRVDTLLCNPGLLERMKECGCAYIGFGLESGVQEILDSYQKGITWEQTKETAAYLTKHRVLHIWYAMLGSGNHLDTPELIKQNIEAIASFPFDLLQLSLLTPFPGTPVFERLSKEGRLLHTNWDLYDGLHCVYQPEGISPEDMEKAFLWAYRKIFVQSGIGRIVHTIRKSVPFWGNTISPWSLLRVARDMIVLKKDMF